MYSIYSIIIIAIIIVYYYCYYYCWLVVSNIFYFPFHIWGCHPSHFSELHDFSRWAHCTTNQIVDVYQQTHGRWKTQRWFPMCWGLDVPWQEHLPGHGALLRGWALRPHHRCWQLHRGGLYDSGWLVGWLVWNMNFIFHFIYGMSSFPLTNSYFSEG